MRKRQSLLWRYLGLIFVAMMLLPVVFPIATIIFYEPVESQILDEGGNPLSGVDVERLWHEEARRLSGAEAAVVEERLRAWLVNYPSASIVWVDEDGVTRLRLPEDAEYPAEWSLSETIRFMKEGYDADPFTTVALLGSEADEGFIALRIPRDLFRGGGGDRFGTGLWEYASLIATLIVFVLFIAVSVLFFYRIRSRMLRLKAAMTSPAEGGIPRPVEVKRLDEIGQLEQSFNDMIMQLEKSREREREEEALRRQLIANLSHDLRTPLTAIRGHAYRLSGEQLSDSGRQSAELIDRKISHMDRLIDNLLSYTLLSAGKFPYHPKSTDIVRLVRMLCASWYPTFEQEGFEIDIDLPDEPVYWTIDPSWLERVLDNVFQNVLRHAKEGRYLGVKVAAEEGRAVISVSDRGGGMTGESVEKGAGIGLSIASLMLREMKLDWQFDSTPNGTTIRIVPHFLNKI